MTGPSVSCCPFLTRSPLKTTICLPIGMKCSSERPVTSSTTLMQRLPRTVSPISMTPSIFAISAASLGWRASKSSATRGRPPVISRVLAASRGVFARSMPGAALSPSRTMTMAPVGMSWLSTTFVPSGVSTAISMRGWRFDSLEGMTTRVFAPVTRSVSVLTETSSSKSTNTMEPATSERTGTE